MMETKKRLKRIHMSSCTVIPLVLQFIKAGSKQPASNPGFSHALKLSYNLISKERLKWTGGTLTYRYRLSEDMGKFSASLLLAIMDELTTNACFGAGMPSSPGVSLQMSLGLCHGRQCSRLSSLRELDVVSTVTKLGRTISFTQTNFIDPEHEEVLAFGSHIKYMPIGNLIMNIVFNQKWAWDIYSRFCLGSPPRFYEEKCLYKDVLGKNIIHMGIGTAAFHMTSEHTNPFGGLHVSGDVRKNEDLS
jgi:hypothetical protein